MQPMLYLELGPELQQLLRDCGVASNDRGGVVYSDESRDTTDVNDAGNRLEQHRCRLLRRGIAAEPPNGPSSCLQEWTPSYNPPI